MISLSKKLFSTNWCTLRKLLVNDPSFHRGDGTQATKKKIVGRVRKNTLYIYTYLSPFRKRVGARPNGRYCGPRLTFPALELRLTIVRGIRWYMVRPGSLEILEIIPARDVARLSSYWFLGRGIKDRPWFMTRAARTHPRPISIPLFTWQLARANSSRFHRSKEQSNPSLILRSARTIGLDLPNELRN